VTVFSFGIAQFVQKMDVLPYTLILCIQIDALDLLLFQYHLITLSGTDSQLSKIFRLIGHYLAKTKMTNFVDNG